MSEIRHYYHIYADGVWEKIVRDHIDALNSSGLIGEIDKIYVGIVGTSHNRQRVKRVLDGLIPNEIIAEADTGWEQVTLNVLHQDCKDSDNFKVFYAHTKGSSNRHELNESWRMDMTEDLVGNWARAVSFLSKYDVVGSFWVKQLSFFAGNFWWANSRFLANLDPPDNSNRMGAESWHRDGNHNKPFKSHNLIHTWPPVQRRKLIRIAMNKEVTGMIVTFRCDGRVLNYKPGRIYEDVLTPGLEALLRNGTNLTLIDPLSLDKVEEPKPEPKPEKAKKVVVPEPVVEEVSADDSDESSDSPEEYSADSGSDY